MSLLFQSFASVDAIDDCIRFAWLYGRGYFQNRPNPTVILLQFVDGLPRFEPEQREWIDGMMKEAKSC